MGPTGTERLTDADAVLIVGPPMTGKYRLFVSMLAAHCDRSIVVSTRTRTAVLRRDVARASGDHPPDRLAVVDCSRREDAAVGGEGLVAHVATPGNLTEIGVEFTGLAETFRDQGIRGRTGVGVYSITQLQMFSEPETVARFLAVLTERISTYGWFGVGVVDETTVQDTERGAVEGHFDAVIETRAGADGGREFRVRDPSDGSNEWTAQTDERD